jgi:fructose-bisphosphate aldolase class II
MGAFPHVGRVANGFHWRDDAGSPARPPPDREAPVPVVAMKEILDRAFAERYGVGAFNVINDLSIEAVLAAAAEERSPVILQTSVKTVRTYGREQLFGIFRALARDAGVPVTLHLDHCPDRAVISDCLDGGWNSVLFDAHELDVAENRRQTTEVVAEARRHGAHVEGEIEGIQGVEDGIGSDEASVRQSLDVAVDFIKATGVDCFAPAIGNAHGQYAAAPVLDAQRVSDLVAATGVPMALHGGTGLSEDQFRDLIGRGCAKVNISTALKESFMRSGLAFLRAADEAGKWDPPSLFAHQRAALVDMARGHMRLFGSSGRAW